MNETAEKVEPGAQPEELEQINQYTRRPLEAGEIYTFSVVLCDNEVDRDFERFSTASLEELAKLFLGKTGIFDHTPKTANQTARIFSTHLESDPERRTKAGEPYTRLVARAYLPRSGKNADLILEIDSGMKKEVSVGCSMGNRICSICGADRGKNNCKHQKGKAYMLHGNSQICHDVLNQPTDAYEWSFVAVPAQREAGVIKHFGGSQGEEFWSAEQVVKQLEQTEDGLRLNKNACQRLLEHLRELDNLAQQGRCYREELTQRTLKFCRLVQPELSSGVLRRITEELNLEDLREFAMAYEKKARDLLPIKPQLAPAEKGIKYTQEVNREFQI